MRSIKLLATALLANILICFAATATGDSKEKVDPRHYSPPCNKKLMQLVNQAAKLSLTDSEKALEILNKAHDMDKLCSPVLSQRVYVLMSMGKEAEARLDLDRMANLAKNWSEAEKKASLAFRDMVFNRVDNAKEHLDEAIELSPKTAYFYLARASMLIQQDKHKEAMLDIQTAESKDPRNYKIYTTKAALYTKLGLEKEVLKELQRAVNLLAEKLNKSD